MKFVAILLAIIALPACAAQNNSRPSSLNTLESCDVFSIEDLFRNPRIYNHKMFCGNAILVVKPYIAFYPSVELAHAPEEVALIPKMNSEQSRELIKMGGGHLVAIRGRIDIDEDCFSGKYVCTPIDRPIGLKDFRITSSNRNLNYRDHH